MTIDVRPPALARLRAHPFLTLALASFLFHVPLVANPGFFNHDEYQKIDHITRFGFADYLSTYSSLDPGEHLGQPMRPLSFAVQGLGALFIYEAPAITHALDVAMHALVVCVFFALLRRCGIDRTVSFHAALLFAISPLVTYAVGWTAALMDRLYVLFTILGLHAGVSWIERRGTPRAPWALVATSLLVAGALLSKETAVVVPAAILVGSALVAMHSGMRSPGRALAAIAIATLLPLALYGAYRVPAVLGTLASMDLDSTPYSISTSARNLGTNLFLYLSYPFNWKLEEASGFRIDAVTLLASLFHALLWIAITLRLGVRWGVAYGVGYLIFLAPVLWLPHPGSHYLYASATVFSLGLASCIGGAPSRYTRSRKLVVALAIGLLSLHSLRNQAQIYAFGSCMAEVESSLYALHSARGEPERLVVEPEPNAPVYVLERLVTGRNQLRDRHPVEVRIATTPVHGHDRVARLASTCRVY